MLIYNYLQIRGKQGYRLLLEIGVLRSMLVAIFFIAPALLLFNHLIHHNAKKQYLSFITGEHIGMLFLGYCAIKVNNFLLQEMFFIKTIGSNKHALYMQNNQRLFILVALEFVVPFSLLQFQSIGFDPFVALL